MKQVPRALLQSRHRTCSMDPTELYAFGLSGTLLLFFVAAHHRRLIKLWLPLAAYVPRLRRVWAIVMNNLMYRALLGRNRLFGPLTARMVLQFVVYVGINACLVCFKLHSTGSDWTRGYFSVVSLEEAMSRSGCLTLVNLIPLYISMHLALIADTFGLSLSTTKTLHQTCGSVTFVLFIFHAVTAYTQHKFGIQDTYKLIVRPANPPKGSH